MWRGFSFGVLVVGLLLGPAQADPLSHLDAVRLFLGVQPSSPVHAGSIVESASGVLVKDLDAPLGSGEDAPRMTVESLTFSNISTEESQATFGSIVGSGFVIRGNGDLSAKSVMLTDVRARDLGVRPLSVASLDNLMMTEVVVAGLARLDAYSVGFSGDMTKSFSGALQLDGLQVAALAAAGLSDRFTLRLEYEGDGATGSFTARPKVVHALLGTLDGEAHWQKARFRTEASTPLAQFDLSEVVSSGKLVEASMSLNPGPNARMLLRALNSQQRADALAMFRQWLARDGSLSTDQTSPWIARAASFLANPSTIGVRAVPPTPVVLGELSVVGMTMRDFVERLGVGLTEDLKPEASAQPAR